jgi:acyl carrier protein
MITEEQVRRIVARELRVPLELVQKDTPLAALPGFDSVQMLMLMVALEEAGVSIPSAEAVNLRTIEDIQALAHH